MLFRSDDNYAQALAGCIPLLHTLSLRDNPGLSDLGTSILLNNAQNGTLFKLDLAYCGLEMLADVMNLLPPTVNQIDISANAASVAEYQRVLPVLSQKNITHLILTDTFGGDAIGLTFVEAFTHRNVSVNVNFSNIGLTAEGAGAILNLSLLNSADFSHNRLTGIGMSLPVMLKNYLSKLNFDNAQLNPKDLQTLIEILPRTHLTDLSLNQNIVNGSLGVSLAKQLILFSTPHMNQLGIEKLPTTVNRDIIRGFRAAKQQGNLQALYLKHAHLEDSAALAFCRLSRLGLDFNFAENPSNLVIDSHNCQFIKPYFPSVGKNAARADEGYFSNKNTFFFRTQTHQLRISNFSQSKINEYSQSDTLGLALLPNLLFALGIIGAFILLCYLTQKTFRWLCPIEKNRTVVPEEKNNSAELTYTRGASV